MLTDMLAAVYFGSVVPMQTLFRQLTGGNDTPMITVLPTLTLAALLKILEETMQPVHSSPLLRRKDPLKRKGFLE